MEGYKVYYEEFEYNEITGLTEKEVVPGISLATEIGVSSIVDNMVINGIAAKDYYFSVSAYDDEGNQYSKVVPILIKIKS